jgi:hypothetical protein
LRPGARVHSAFGILHQGRELRTGRGDEIPGVVPGAWANHDGAGDRIRAGRPNLDGPAEAHVVAPAHLTFHERRYPTGAGSGRYPDETCAIYGFASRMRQVVRPQP